MFIFLYLIKLLLFPVISIYWITPAYIVSINGGVEKCPPYVAACVRVAIQVPNISLLTIIVSAQT